MRRIRTLAAGAALITGPMLAAGVGLAAPAVAEPGPPPCGPSLFPICNFLPIAPQLDGDVDLTTNQPEAPGLEDVPPVDPCAAGCI
ncbi:fibronectin-binding protein [Mycolicibacterium palauense]|uniref:fibronectin-binding protein n=1 Tax=Mycolicibacterium palauense TaxID=2034511 RepID=UPI000BFED574|nr:fibronectin-binding protein [Mycolicibacterium palauense]